MLTSSPGQTQPQTRFQQPSNLPTLPRIPHHGAGANRGGARRFPTAESAKRRERAAFQRWKARAPEACCLPAVESAKRRERAAFQRWKARAPEACCLPAMESAKHRKRAAFQRWKARSVWSAASSSAAFRHANPARRSARRPEPLQQILKLLVDVRLGLLHRHKTRDQPFAILQHQLLHVRHLGVDAPRLPRQRRLARGH